MAGVVADIPVKFLIAVGFNVILYFLAGLRMEASNFFIFFLFNFMATLTVGTSAFKILKMKANIPDLVDVPNLPIDRGVNENSLASPCHRRSHHSCYRYLHWIHYSSTRDASLV